MTRTCAPSRGFATTTALMLVALVGSAILAVTTLTAADFRRTIDEARDAQLRQLVLAGALDLKARQRVGTPAASYELALPREMVERGGGANVRIDSSDRARAIITVRFADRQFVQNLSSDPADLRSRR